MPSTQKPDPHWLAPAQVAPPASLGTQTPPEHQSPPAQSASREQLPRHAVGPHTYGSQVCVCTAGHVPAPSQPAPSVATPAAQLPSRQTTEESG